MVCSSRKTAGVTLIELLVVMTIMISALALVGFLFSFFGKVTIMHSCAPIVWDTLGTMLTLPIL